MRSNTDHTDAVWQLLTSYILAFVKRFSLKSEVDGNGFPSGLPVCLQIIGPTSHCPEGKREQLRAVLPCMTSTLPFPVGSQLEGGQSLSGR